MTVSTQLDIRPLSPLIGAEIGGLDLSRPLGDTLVAEVRRALNTHHVIFFRDQDLSPTRQADFARQFGEVTEGHPVLPALGDNPEVLAIDGSKDRASWWHTDVTFLQAPAFGSILYMLTAPDVGGDTTWASLQDAYDRLADPVREMCDALIAIHFDPWFAADVDANGGYEWEGVRHDKLLPALHPVVRTHPETGRATLFVNAMWTKRVVGLGPAASDALLLHLCAQATVPEYQCRVHWTPDMVLFWDNRAVQHYALSDYTEPRLMIRSTLRGDTPF